MTLRLRLLLLLVALCAGGLVISDVVTYTSLRSFLVTQVDNQLRVATFPVGRALLPTSGSGTAGSPSSVVAPSVPPATPTPATSVTPTTRAPGGGTFGPGENFRVSPPGTDRGVLVPPGSYGELRDAGGRVQAHVFFSYGGKAPAIPAIPGSLPGSGGHL